MSAAASDAFVSWRRRAHPALATLATIAVVSAFAAWLLPEHRFVGIAADLTFQALLPAVATAVILILGRSSSSGVLAIHRPPRQAAWWVAVPTLVLVALAILVTRLSGQSFSEQNELMRTSAFPVWLAEEIAAVTVVPFVEEALFRGVLQTELKRRFGTIAALVSTSLAFGGLHWSGTDEIGLLQFGLLCTVGLVLGIVRERTDSLGASIAVHGLYNAVLSALEFVL